MLTYISVLALMFSVNSAAQSAAIPCLIKIYDLPEAQLQSVWIRIKQKARESPGGSFVSIGGIQRIQASLSEEAFAEVSRMPEVESIVRDDCSTLIDRPASIAAEPPPPDA